jgi:predicted phage terminase large subunit-like protein
MSRPGIAEQLDPEAFLEALDPDEREEFLALSELRHGGEGLADFIARIAPGEAPPRHLMPLIEAIERARRERVRVCISMPPRHGKTVTILRAIVWWLLRTPADTCGYFSYNHDIARSKSRIARDIARTCALQLSDPNDEVRLELASDKNALQEWRTRAGGGLLAGGAGGGLTGQGITGFICVDDPFKNPQDAESLARREDVWEWFNAVVFTRLEHASVIVVHTRWNDDDLIGRLEKQGGWEILKLQAICEGEGDPLGRARGEALWPERFPAEELGTKPDQPGTVRGQIGEFLFAALYQQDPRPRGATIFGPAFYYDPQKLDLTEARIMIGGDPAATKKTTADYSVLVAMAVWGYDAEMRAAILEVYRKQKTIPDFVSDALEFQSRWPGAEIVIEAVAGFKSVPDLLLDIDPTLPVKGITPLGDKFQRAQPYAAAWNGGRVLVPVGAPWVKAYVQELKVFTGVNDLKDDQVDASAHAWNEAQNQITFFRPGGAILPRRQ